MKGEKEIRKMIDKMDRKIEEDPFYNDVFAPKEDSPLYHARLALKWVLGEMELKEEVRRQPDEKQFKEVRR